MREIPDVIGGRSVGAAALADASVKPERRLIERVRTDGTPTSVATSRRPRPRDDYEDGGPTIQLPAAAEPLHPFDLLATDSIRA